MSLIIFDETWYCDNCDERFKDEDNLLFCPNCGNLLKNDFYQMILQSIEKYLKEFSISICKKCGEEFDVKYNFCPFCSNELKKQNIFVRVEKDNSITAYWNGEEICVFNKDIFLSHPHFSESAVMDCFRWKSLLDKKIEFDFIGINRKLPQKLSFKETFSIFILRENGIIVNNIIKFLPYYNETNLDEHYEPYNIKVLKIRENLYVKLAVDHIVY